VIALGLALQLASVSQIYGDQLRQFEPYRVCVLSKAKELARSAEPIAALEKAAKSECRVDYVAAEADLAFDEAQLAAAELPNPGGYHPRKHFSEMEQALSEDFAAAVVRQRLNR